MEHNAWFCAAICCKTPQNVQYKYSLYWKSFGLVRHKHFKAMFQSVQAKSLKKFYSGTSGDHQCMDEENKHQNQNIIFLLSNIQNNAT